MIKETLFNRKNGRDQVWKIEQEGNKYRTIHGQVDGKMVTSEWTVCEGKNIGRSNETTPEEQCESEVLSKIERQKDKGYAENIEDSSSMFKPMLAKKFVSFDKLKNTPVFSQPKLDGVRCFITKDGAFSRNNKPIKSIPHILKELKPFFETEPNLILDGELYNHALKDNFNEIISIIRKTKLSLRDLVKAKKNITYFIYDFSTSNDVVPYFERLKILKERYGHFFKKYTEILETVEIENSKELDRHFKEYMLRGFEGQMVRTSEGTYEKNKRSSGLLKRKEFESEEFEIIDILEGKGNRSGVAGSFQLVDKDTGEQFNANMKGDMDLYKDLLSNKEEYIGKLATVVYQNKTPKGIPRFPVVHSIRDYE